MQQNALTHPPRLYRTIGFVAMIVIYFVVFGQLF